MAILPPNCTGAQRLSSYYAGEGIIPIGTVGFPSGIRTLIPVTGRIALSNFFGAMYDAGQILNGSFEVPSILYEDATRTNFVGWTLLKQTTRLNFAASILGCFTPNVVTALSPPPPVGYTSPGDNVVYATDLPNNPSFPYRLLDITNPLFSNLAPPGATSNYILELQNIGTFGGAVSPTNPNMYGIMRGPVLVSDNSFSFAVGDTVSFKWRAVKDAAGDRYAVFAYLVSPGSCKRIVLLDAYGNDTGSWQSVSYTLADSSLADTYRIVIVHGSYDSTGGLKVGAYLYLSSFQVTKVS